MDTGIQRHESILSTDSDYDILDGADGDDEAVAEVSSYFKRKCLEIDVSLSWY